MKKILVASVLITSTISTAWSGEVYGGYGLVTGAHAGFSHRLTEKFGVRAEANTFNYSRSFSISGSQYAAKADVSGASVYVDYMALWPITSHVRLTAGLGLGKSDLSADKSSGTTVTLGDNSYILRPEDKFGMNIRYPSLMPYLGLGTGHHRSEKGFNFYADAGVFFGKPDLTFHYSDAFKGQIKTDLNPNGTISVADLQKEEAKVRAEVDKIKFMPVIKLGVSYSFD